MESWQAKLVYYPGRLEVGLYLFRRRDIGIREFLTNGGDVVVTVSRDKPGNEEDLLFASLDEDQVKALQAAISEYGIKLPEASYTQGKLEATESHLTDMRKLVFKEKA